MTPEPAMLPVSLDLPRPCFEWTAAKMAELRRRWLAGETPRDIQRALGCETRNQVIGKAHRMKLPGRPSPIKRYPGAIRTAPVQRKRPTRTYASTEQAKHLRRQAAKEGHDRPYNIAPGFDGQLSSRDCAWPIGHPGDADFKFCSSKALSGKPYCPEHCGKAFVRRKLPDQPSQQEHPASP